MSIPQLIQIILYIYKIKYMTKYILPKCINCNADLISNIRIPEMIEDKIDKIFYLTCEKCFIRLNKKRKSVY
jgi:hypothetical protein